MTQTQLILGVFLGTPPLLGTITWALLQNDKQFSGLGNRIGRLEAQNDKIIDILADLRERLARLEERDRLTHQLVK